MQYALVNGVRQEAHPRASGECPSCRGAMLAKCGSRVVHHWAHASRQNCDPWWENETKWHRDWKERFPINCREVVHTADDGEIHRADIKTPSGITLEVQNSPMDDGERLSREAFYSQLIWILNGAAFRNNFNIYHPLPSPDAEISKDLVWHRTRRSLPGTHTGAFCRRSEHVEGSSLQLLHPMQEILEQVRIVYAGHHQYDWVQPRRTWLESRCPVFIDFGGEQLVRVERYGEQQLPCVRFVDLDAFVQEAMTTTIAKAVGISILRSTTTFETGSFREKP